jgi:hypothetical protein
MCAKQVAADFQSFRGNVANFRNHRTSPSGSGSASSPPGPDSSGNTRSTVYIFYFSSLEISYILN